MSVMLIMKMDIDTSNGTFTEVTEAAFPEEGVYRMLELPALQWKIWLKDEANEQVSGVYLFAAREAAEGYAKMASENIGIRPGIKNLTNQIWDIYEDKTQITKGPIDLPLIKELRDTVI